MFESANLCVANQSCVPNSAGAGQPKIWRSKLTHTKQTHDSRRDGIQSSSPTEESTDNVKGTEIHLPKIRPNFQIHVQPEFAAFEKIVSEASPRPNIVPIFATIPGYFLTPSAAYLKISQGSSKSFLLESVVGGDQIGRYSWIGANPFHVIESGPGRAVEGDPLIELEKVLSQYKTVNVPGVPPFQGDPLG